MLSDCEIYRRSFKISFENLNHSFPISESDITIVRIMTAGDMWMPGHLTTQCFLFRYLVLVRWLLYIEPYSTRRYQRLSPPLFFVYIFDVYMRHQASMINARLLETRTVWFGMNRVYYQVTQMYHCSRLPSSCTLVLSRKGQIMRRVHFLSGESTDKPYVYKTTWDIKGRIVILES